MPGWQRGRRCAHSEKPNSQNLQKKNRRSENGDGNLSFVFRWNIFWRDSRKSAVQVLEGLNHISWNIRFTRYTGTTNIPFLWPPNPYVQHSTSCRSYQFFSHTLEIFFCTTNPTVSSGWNPGSKALTSSWHMERKSSHSRVRPAMARKQWEEQRSLKEFWGLFMNFMNSWTKQMLD